VANVLSLALRVTADASGLKLDPVQRALVRLGDEADKLTGQFDKFTGTSEAAARVQAAFADRAQELTNILRDGGPGAATQYAAAFERLTEEINKEAAAFERAARITEANLTNFERFERAQVELREQVDAGRISQETYNRAVESAARNLTDAERAAAGLAARTAEVAETGDTSALKFNELSGIFAVLPGPLGNIAGRISGISSASEGLSRIFAGGLRSGITNLVGSFTALVNPLTLGLAGITAFTAGAAAVARGLVNLEDRVERLSRLANQLGVSFEFVQTLEEAGRRADVSVEQLGGSFARLQNTLAGADEESKKATAALQRLGVSVSDFGDLSQQSQIELIGEKLREIEDPAQRSAAAIALFGRSGVQLIPFFNELEGAAVDIQRFGGAMTDLERIDLNQNLGGALDAIGRATTRLGEIVLLPFTGFVADVTNSLADLFGTVNRVAELLGRVFKPAIDALGASFKILGFLLQQLNRGIDFVFGTAKVAADSASKAVGEARKTLEKPLNTGIARDLERAMGGVRDAIKQSTQLIGEFGSRAAFETDRFNKELEFLGRQFDRTTAGGIKAYTAAVQDATVAYQANIQAIRTAQQERERMVETERNVANTLIEQLRIQREFGGDNQRAQAANNVLIIEREIARAQAFGPGNEAAQERIRQLQEILNVQLQIADGSTQQQEADRKRVETLLGQTEKVSEVEQNILAIKREQERVQASIADSVFGASDEAFRAAEQAAAEQEEQLNRLLAQQEELLKAQQLGFADGFDAAFANVGKGIETLIAKASEFGDAGLEAARQFEQGIAAAQERARDPAGGGSDQYEAEVARQQELFDKELANIKALADERKRVNEFVDQQIELARFGGDQQRLQASRNAAAIEAEIGRVTAEVNAARAAGEQQAVRAGIERLAQLDQAAAKENDIASGKAQEREQQRKFFEEQAKAAQQQQQQEQQRQQQIQQAQQQAQEEQAKAAAAEFERQSKRIRALNSIGQQSIGGADIRSTEGASQFIQAAAGAFDPNLAQQRAQTKLLQKIVENSGALQFLERGVGQSVRILGGIP